MNNTELLKLTNRDKERLAHMKKGGNSLEEYELKNLKEEIAEAIVSSIDLIIKSRDYGRNPIKKANAYIYAKLHHYIEDLQEDSALDEERIVEFDRILSGYYHMLLNHTAGCESFKRYCEYACSFALIMDETIRPCLGYLQTYNIRV